MVGSIVEKRYRADLLHLHKRAAGSPETYRDIILFLSAYTVVWKLYLECNNIFDVSRDFHDNRRLGVSANVKLFKLLFSPKNVFRKKNNHCKYI